MNRDRRTFLRMAGAAAFAGSASDLARGQGTAKAFFPPASWDCGMKDGIPNPESGVLVLEARIKLDRLARIGKTPNGDRRVAVGLEGSLSGPKLAGKVMTGALDYELTLSNGVVEVEDLLVFQTDDGKYI